MNTIINFLKDIDMAALVMIVLFGIPFAAMIVYAIVLHRRGKKMGVIYDHSKETDDESWKIDKSPLGPFLSDINEPPWDHYFPR